MSKHKGNKKYSKKKPPSNPIAMHSTPKKGYSMGGTLPAGDHIVFKNGSLVCADGVVIGHVAEGKHDCTVTDDGSIVLANGNTVGHVSDEKPFDWEYNTGMVLHEGVIQSYKDMLKAFDNTFFTPKAEVEISTVEETQLKELDAIKKHMDASFVEDTLYAQNQMIQYAKDDVKQMMDQGLKAEFESHVGFTDKKSAHNALYGMPVANPGLFQGLTDEAKKAVNTWEKLKQQYQHVKPPPLGVLSPWDNIKAEIQKPKIERVSFDCIWVKAAGILKLVVYKGKFRFTAHIKSAKFKLVWDALTEYEIETIWLYVADKLHQHFDYKHVYDSPSGMVNSMDAMKMEVKHPIEDHTGTVDNIIINLNDGYKWSREKIADWLDTLDEQPMWEIGGDTSDSDEDEHADESLTWVDEMQ